MRHREQERETTTPPPLSRLRRRRCDLIRYVRGNPPPYSRLFLLSLSGVCAPHLSCTHSAAVWRRPITVRSGVRTASAPPPPSIALFFARQREVNERRYGTVRSCGAQTVIIRRPRITWPPRVCRMKNFFQNTNFSNFFSQFLKFSRDFVYFRKIFHVRRDVCTRRVRHAVCLCALGSNVWPFCRLRIIAPTVFAQFELRSSAFVSAELRNFSVPYDDCVVSPALECVHVCTPPNVRSELWPSKLYSRYGVY